MYGVQITCRMGQGERHRRDLDNATRLSNKVVDVMDFRSYPWTCTDSGKGRDDRSSQQINDLGKQHVLDQCRLRRRGHPLHRLQRRPHRRPSPRSGHRRTDLTEGSL